MWPSGIMLVHAIALAKVLVAQGITDLCFSIAIQRPVCHVHGVSTFVCFWSAEATQSLADWMATANNFLAKLLHQKVVVHKRRCCSMLTHEPSPEERSPDSTLWSCWPMQRPARNYPCHHSSAVGRHHHPHKSWWTTPIPPHQHDAACRASGLHQWVK